MKRTAWSLESIPVFSVLGNVRWRRRSAGTTWLQKVKYKLGNNFGRSLERFESSKKVARCHTVEDQCGKVGHQCCIRSDTLVVDII